MFGLEVWFVRGKNYKEFTTHEITFRRLIAGYTRMLKRSYSHSTVATVVKNFMIHRTQRRAHVERMEDNIVLVSNAVRDLGGKMTRWETLKKVVISTVRLAAGPT
jgi:hypothetical protein